MSLEDCEGTEDIIKKYGRNEKDSGSPEVQIAIITKRLSQLGQHFNGHPQDKHSRQGLLKLVSKRKRLLGYLRREDVGRYRAALENFGLRK